MRVTRLDGEIWPSCWEEPRPSSCVPVCLLAPLDSNQRRFVFGWRLWSLAAANRITRLLPRLKMKMKIKFTIAVAVAAAAACDSFDHHTEILAHWLIAHQLRRWAHATHERELELANSRRPAAAVSIGALIRSPTWQTTTPSLVGTQSDWIWSV